MSLVNLAHVCSHLQNASKARLGLTSIPCTKMLHTLMLQLQRSGYVSSVTIGGPTPPPPSSLNPILDPSDDSVSSHIVQRPQPQPTQSSEDAPAPAPQTPEQIPVAKRRLWVGLKYWNSEPVLYKMGLVSKPTRRVWMGFRDIDRLAKGDHSGYVRGLRGVGESMYVTTDQGIMEVRECSEKRTGGMLLCRVNGV
ncbi:MAG: hypothetical protein LQ350_001817 [Teloschistes chrysophthalmus]|nr:MAG: hypothetical protein LQ350_001817 [Niorma chrysophthalma]